MKNQVYTDLEYREEEDYLFDWVFHYNPYTKAWAAIPREQYTQYWNNAAAPGILRATSFDTLRALVMKIHYNPEYLDHYQDQPAIPGGTDLG